MISLLFRILGDATGFNRTMNRDLPAAAKQGGEKAGKEAGGSFGKEFGTQVKGAIMGAIGVGAIAQTIKESIIKAREIAKDAAVSGLSVEATQELQRASKLTGLSQQELLDSASKAPAEFAALMRHVQKNGGPTMNEAEVESLTGMGATFGDMKSGVFKGIARMWSGGSGLALDSASRVAAVVAAIAEKQRQVTGLGGETVQQNIEQLARASEMLAQMATANYERSYGIAQGTLNTPAGELVRKLEEINNTIKDRF